MGRPLKIPPMAFAAAYALVVPLAAGLLVSPVALAQLHRVDGQVAAGWAQAIMSAGAIFAAVWLQGRGRAHAREDRLAAIVALGRDVLDVFESAEETHSVHGLGSDGAAFFQRAVEMRVDLIRQFDHGSYDPIALEHVLRLLTLLQTAARILLQLAAAPAAKVSARRKGLLGPCAVEARHVVRQLEEIAGLQPTPSPMVRTSLP